MKKIILALCVILCLSRCHPAMAAPIDHVSYSLSFTGKMAGEIPEPSGRWIDEIFALITIEVERIAWEDGALTEAEFLVEGRSACTFGVLALEDDVYLCGSLFPEVPLLIDATQRDSALRLAEALFPPEAALNESWETKVSYADLRAWLTGASMELRKLIQTDESVTEAVADLLRSMADIIRAENEDSIALYIKQEPIYKSEFPMEGDKSTADVGMERLFKSLISALAVVE